MINGAHVVLYSKDAEADRNFFRDVLRDKFVINTLSERRTPFALIENWEARLSKR